MKNIMSLMVTQKKSKVAKKNLQSVIKTPIKMDFIPYLNFGLIFDKFHKSKRTRELIMSREDEHLKESHLFDDRDYISDKLIHDERTYLSSVQNRQLINYALKLIMPEKTIKQFLKQGLTIKEISDYFMVHTEIVYMRLNLNS